MRQHVSFIPRSFWEMVSPTSHSHLAFSEVTAAATLTIQPFQRHQSETVKNGFEYPQGTFNTSLKRGVNETRTVC
jgi:hypothetical protein